MQREALTILYLTLGLTATGVLMVFSASPVIAMHVFEAPPLIFAQRQIMFAIMGLVVLGIMVRFDYHRLADRGMLFLIGSVALALQLVVVFTSFGAEAGGATRWLSVGPLRFQPSEVAKVAIILLLAGLLCRRHEHIRRFFAGFLPPVVLTGLFAGAVVLQKDIGTPVVIGAVAGMMMFAAGARFLHIGVCAAPAVAAVVYLVQSMGHRMDRIKAYLDPWAYPSAEGFQLIQSMTAFARGGLVGQGPGAGQQKLLHLPEAHTDFIFAVWAEEMGFVGSVALACGFALLMLMAFRVAQHAPDLLGALLAIGIGSLITVQALMSMAVNTGLVPTKGLSLPFISSGGSGLLVNMALMGILINIALQSEVLVRRRSLQRPARTAA